MRVAAERHIRCGRHVRASACCSIQVRAGGTPHPSHHHTPAQPCHPVEHSEQEQAEQLQLPAPAHLVPRLPLSSLQQLAGAVGGHGVALVPPGVPPRHAHHAARHEARAAGGVDGAGAADALLPQQEGGVEGGQEVLGRFLPGACVWGGGGGRRRRWRRTWGVLAAERGRPAMPGVQPSRASRGSGMPSCQEQEAGSIQAALLEQATSRGQPPAAMRPSVCWNQVRDGSVGGKNRHPALAPHQSRSR
jgi:hypothetical protein